MLIDEPRCSIRKCIKLEGVQRTPAGLEYPVCGAFPFGIPDTIGYKGAICPYFKTIAYHSTPQA